MFRKWEKLELSLTNNYRESDRKLRILILLLYYHPHLTGLTLYVRTIAEALAKRGHKVTVVASHHTKETPLGDSMLNGVRVVRLWAPIRISRGLVMPTYPWKVYRLLREHDVVNIHIPLLETALVAVLAGIAGVRIIPTHHGDLILPKSLANGLITRIMFAMYKFMAERVPAIVGHSDDYANHSYYLSPYRYKVRTVFPPIFVPIPEPERVCQLQREWRCEDGPLIAYSGRFVQEKRPDLLIRALEVINVQYPNARVVFAGQYDIPYEDTWQRHRDLVKRFDSQLLFLGLLKSRQDLANFYAACDVFVLPSDSEGFAMAQVEAMLCGTPVVMTDIPGGRVAVTRTGMGKLAKRGDWKSIGETIIEVLDEPAEFTKPREYIADIFSFEKFINQYEAIFQEYAKN